VDSTANSISGSLIGGAGWSDQKFGTALDLNGTSGYVLTDVPNKDHFSAWVRTSKSTGNQSVVGNYNNANGLNKKGILIATGTAAVQSRVTSGEALNSSGYSVSDNAWHHINGVVESGDRKVYVDGLLR